MNALKLTVKQKLGKIRNWYHEKIHFSEKFGGRANLDIEAANHLLGEMILSERPFSVVRIGFVEMDFFYERMMHSKYPFYFYRDKRMFESLDNSETEMAQYFGLLKKAYGNTDMIANWYSSRREEALVEEYAAKTATLTKALVLEPYFFDSPWSKSLKGKRVLIVSPFTELIVQQYEKREQLFQAEVLPEFELITVQSVWYAGKDKDTRFATWMEALDYLKDQIAGKVFDIALLGCGSFGIPLVDYIKDLGKQAVYIGGALQLMFGIRGSRWDNSNAYKKFYNDAWVRPGEETKPAHSKAIDNNCYW